MAYYHRRENGDYESYKDYGDYMRNNPTSKWEDWIMDKIVCLIGLGVGCLMCLMVYINTDMWSLGFWCLGLPSAYIVLCSIYAIFTKATWDKIRNCFIAFIIAFFELISFGDYLCPNI